MGLWAELKGWLLFALSVLVGVVSAFFVGSQKGAKQAKQAAEDQAERERAVREAAGAKRQVDAVQTRQKVEDETNRKGADEARKNLADRWTRPS